MRVTATAGDDATLSIDGVPFTAPAWPVQTIASWVPVTDEVIADASSGRTVGQVMTMLITEAIDRTLNPWRYADRNPMPHFVALPRLARATQRARDTRIRASDALDVLRHGLPETDW